MVVCSWQDSSRSASSSCTETCQCPSSEQAHLQRAAAAAAAGKAISCAMSLQHMRDSTRSRTDAPQHCQQPAAQQLQQSVVPCWVLHKELGQLHLAAQQTSWGHRRQQQHWASCEQQLAAGTLPNCSTTSLQCSRHCHLLRVFTAMVQMLGSRSSRLTPAAVQAAALASRRSSSCVLKVVTSSAPFWLTLML